MRLQAGAAFIFSNKPRNRIKILYFDGTGPWVGGLYEGVTIAIKVLGWQTFLEQKADCSAVNGSAR